MAATVKVVVKELGPDLLQDFLRFFDHDAFQDNEWWCGCYCGFYEDPCSDEEWDASAAAGPKHRQDKTERILSGKAKGFLAYINGRPVGWCNAAPRDNYANLRRYQVAADDPGEPVGTIMCFVVAEPYRRRGVATALLQAACKKFTRDGLEVAEAYPLLKTREGPNHPPWTASNYHGPLELFLKAGFKIHREFDWFAVVRKKLKSTPFFFGGK